jgi:predicted acetyltransferase
MTDSPDPDAITLRRATQADGTLLGNLLELYIHDLSDLFALKPGPDGRFGYAKLPLYWSEPTRRVAYVIQCGAEVVGFALVTLGSPAGTAQDWDMAEFFILRAYRRAGLASRAAMMILESTPGNWIIRVSERNAAALKFWEKIVKSHARDGYGCREHRGESHLFKVFEFMTR